MIHWQELLIFVFVFIVVSMIGFFAARWRAGNLNRLQEWGLAGKRFGAFISWFLIGGDIYTAYSFLAVPALVFAQGAIGFFAVPYLTLAYPLAFVFLPRFWVIARHRGYVTAADFVRERFDSKPLALATAITGILATLPYIALQIYGVQLCLAEMGVPVELALFIAFAILAAYTYVSGLRGSALIAIVKDVCIWLVVLIMFFSLVSRFGGMHAIFSAMPQQKMVLSSTQYSSYITLILGSSLALFLYPHSLTAILSANSRKVVARSTSFLLAYVVLIGLVAMLGVVAVAAGIHASPVYKTNIALPALLTTLFPQQFTGFAFAAISIGALVPAGVMSIGASNLFTRNIYREYIDPNCTERQEARVAKTASLVVKVGALAFILFFPTTFAINLQLLSNIWILQTLPSVFLGLYTNWFHRTALLIGWFCGMVAGTLSIVALNFQGDVYPFTFFGFHFPMYGAIAGLLVNLSVTIVLTIVFRYIGISSGEDRTVTDDYKARPVIAKLRPAFSTSGMHVQEAFSSQQRASAKTALFAVPIPPPSQPAKPPAFTLPAPSQASVVPLPRSRPTGAKPPVRPVVVTSQPPEQGAGYRVVPKRPLQ